MKHVIAAWGELAAGPGWANRLINVLECDEHGKLSIRLLQPHEQPDEAATLLGISAIVTGQMVRAVTRKGGAA